VEAVEDITGAVRVVLGALSPLERTVFVLREVLEWSYPDLARLLDRSEPALRQLNHRAKARVAAAEPRFEATPGVVATVSEALVGVGHGEGVEDLLDALAPGVRRVRAGYERLSCGRMRHLVSGIVLGREGRLLLCRRPSELPWYPGVWDVAGGHLRPGEPAAACAVRAAREELRISVTAPELVEQVTGDDFRLTLFQAHSWEGEPRNAAPGQHTDVAFVTRDQAARMSLASPSILTLFDRIAA
jgi:8-oxo-dGTP pyrophosphatase MutT (NUDIX family)